MPQSLKLASKESSWSKRTLNASHNTIQPWLKQDNKFPILGNVNFTLLKRPIPINRHAQRQASVTYNLNGKKSTGTDPEIREMVEFVDKHFKQLLYICPRNSRNTWKWGEKPVLQREPNEYSSNEQYTIENESFTRREKQWVEYWRIKDGLFKM